MLLYFASQVAVIVMGHAGAGNGKKRPRAGSVTEHCMRHANCPVIATRKLALHIEE